MNEVAQVMLSTVSKPDEVSRNQRIYTKESYKNMLEEYNNRFGNLKVPVVIRKPGTLTCEVPLRDMVGHVDMSNPINVGTGTVQVETNDLDNLKYLSTDQVEIGMRALGKIEKCEGDAIRIDLKKLICFELLPKTSFETMIEEE